MKIVKSPVASSTPFDNATNGFAADDTQAAIEEARDTALRLARLTIRATANGTVGNNDWIGPTEIQSNTPFMVAPYKLRIGEVSWSNEKTNVQCRVRFRVGSKTGSIFYTLTITSTNPGYGYASGINFLLNAGDTVWAQYLDDGRNMSDADFVLWMVREA